MEEKLKLFDNRRAVIEGFKRFQKATVMTFYSPDPKLIMVTKEYWRWPTIVCNVLRCIKGCNATYTMKMRVRRGDIRYKGAPKIMVRVY